MPPHLHAVCLGLLALALRWVAAEELKPPAQGERYGEYPFSTSVPQGYVLTNSSTLDIVRRVATRRNPAVIFTTLRFGDPGDARTSKKEDQMDMLSNFCYWLHRAGRLQHTMLITTDERTWGGLHERGLPAYLDRAFPRRSSYAEHVRPPDTWNREFDVEKHWWGWRLASLGFRVLYMDSDAVVLRDPLTPFDQPFDVQGLSDWMEPELQQGMALIKTCPGNQEGLYAMVAEPRVPQGSMLREVFNLRPETPRLHVVSPCQSTGVWYLQPTDSTVAFMRAVVDRIAYHAVYDWDQSAWNEIIVAFFGMGEQPPLRYRLLPHSQHSNIGVYRERKARGLVAGQVTLHMGFIPGWDKARLYTEEGLFHPEFRENLISAAATLPVGGRAGSGSAWTRLAFIMMPFAAVAGVHVGRRASRRRSQL